MLANVDNDPFSEWDFTVNNANEIYGQRVTAANAAGELRRALAIARAPRPGADICGFPSSSPHPWSVASR